MSDREWLQDQVNDVAKHGAHVMHEIDMRRAVAMLPAVLASVAERSATIDAQHESILRFSATVQTQHESLTRAHALLRQVALTVQFSDATHHRALLADIRKELAR